MNALNCLNADWLFITNAMISCTHFLTKRWRNTIRLHHSIPVQWLGSPHVQLLLIFRCGRGDSKRNHHSYVLAGVYWALRARPYAHASSHLIFMYVFCIGSQYVFPFCKWDSAGLGLLSRSHRLHSGPGFEHQDLMPPPLPQMSLYRYFQGVHGKAALFNLNFQLNVFLWSWDRVYLFLVTTTDDRNGMTVLELNVLY